MSKQNIKKQKKFACYFSKTRLKDPLPGITRRGCKKATVEIKTHTYFLICIDALVFPILG